MRLRNITGSREVIAESPYVVPEDTLESCPGTWHEIFGNDHPIHIEIGMGKGRFLHTATVWSGPTIASTWQRRRRKCKKTRLRYVWFGPKTHGWCARLMLLWG